MNTTHMLYTYTHIHSFFRSLSLYLSFSLSLSATLYLLFFSPSFPHSHPSFFLSFYLCGSIFLPSFFSLSPLTQICVVCHSRLFAKQMTIKHRLYLSLQTITTINIFKSYFASKVFIQPLLLPISPFPRPPK